MYGKISNFNLSVISDTFTHRNIIPMNVFSCKLIEDYNQNISPQKRYLICVTHKSLKSCQEKNDVFFAEITFILITDMALSYKILQFFVCIQLSQLSKVSWKMYTFILNLWWNICLQKSLSTYSWSETSPYFVCKQFVPEFNCKRQFKFIIS